MGKLIVASQAEIIAGLSRLGMRFTTFSLSTDGNYAPEDARWNYLDMPHFEYVHKQSNAVGGVADDVVSSGIVLQAFPFVRLPLIVTLYQSSETSVTYFTSFGMFLVVIETDWHHLDVNKTRVTTTYAVGTKTWLFSLLFPLVRYSLTRNYHQLMSQDLPMREWRGHLRQKGYDFIATTSIADTTKIMDTNVIVPPQNVLESTVLRGWPDVVVKLGELLDGEVRSIGEDDHYGIQIIRRGRALAIYPRLCPHEGAKLCAPVASVEVLRCPWHGRKFRPIVELNAAHEGEVFSSPWHTFHVERDETFRFQCNVARSTDRRRDWTQSMSACPPVATTEGGRNA